MGRPFVSVSVLAGAIVLFTSASPQKKPVALDRKLTKELAELSEAWWKARPPTRFVEWDTKARAEFESRAKSLGQIPEGALPAVVDLLWASAKKFSPKPVIDGDKLTIQTPYGPAWAYVVMAKKHPPLMIGLHGGGEDAGSADESRSTWTRQGCTGVYPQGIRLVHDTWNTVHGERFILTLIEIAKLQFDVDPEHVVVGGVSMGGTGSWFTAGRHADLLSGAAPFSGVFMAEPKSQLEFKEEVKAIQHGLVPNVRNLAMAYAIGLADKNTMPGTYLFVADRLAELAKADPGGYAKIHFATIPGMAHTYPPGEPTKALDYLLAERRDNFPSRVVWEYASSPYPEPESSDLVTRLGMNCFYWVGCKEPRDRQTIIATRKGNEIEVEARGTAHGTTGITLFLNPTMIDPAAEVIVKSGGKELYRGKPLPDVWTVLETLDARMDRVMVFDRRIEL